MCIWRLKDIDWTRATCRWVNEVLSNSGSNPIARGGLIELGERL
jgi:hypothetical protein